MQIADFWDHWDHWDHWDGWDGWDCKLEIDHKRHRKHNWDTRTRADEEVGREKVRPGEKWDTPYNARWEAGPGDVPKFSSSLVLGRMVFGRWIPSVIVPVPGGG